MQEMFITGGLGRDSELKQTKSGDEVLTFPVGVSQVSGESKTTNWYRCSVWGKRARSLHQYLLKGVKVTVAGSFVVGEYEGKAQFNIIVNKVEFMSRADNAASGRHTPQPNNSGYDEDLNDDVPF